MRPVNMAREALFEKIRKDRYSVLLKPTEEYSSFAQLQVPIYIPSLYFNFHVDLYSH